MKKFSLLFLRALPIWALIGLCFASVADDELMPAVRLLAFAFFAVFAIIFHSRGKESGNLWKYLIVLAVVFNPFLPLRVNQDFMHVLILVLPISIMWFVWRLDRDTFKTVVWGVGAFMVLLVVAMAIPAIYKIINEPPELEDDETTIIRYIDTGEEHRKSKVRFLDEEETLAPPEAKKSAAIREPEVRYFNVHQTHNANAAETPEHLKFLFSQLITQPEYHSLTKDKFLSEINNGKQFTVFVPGPDGVDDKVVIYGRK